jgi:hypothetical protein
MKPRPNTGQPGELVRLMFNCKDGVNERIGLSGDSENIYYPGRSGFIRETKSAGQVRSRTLRRCVVTRRNFTGDADAQKLVGPGN